MTITYIKPLGVLRGAINKALRRDSISYRRLGYARRYHIRDMETYQQATEDNKRLGLSVHKSNPTVSLLRLHKRSRRKVTLAKIGGEP